MAPPTETQAQPWKKWYSAASEPKAGPAVVMPLLQSGAGSGGAGGGLPGSGSFKVDFSQPKPKPQE